MAVHAQYLPANRFVLCWVNHAVDMLGFSDSDVNTNNGAAGGVAGLKTILLAKTPQAQYSWVKNQAALAFQAGKDDGAWTDSGVNGVTTIAGLAALLTGNDSSLVASERRSFAFPQ